VCVCVLVCLIMCGLLNLNNEVTYARVGFLHHRNQSDQYLAQIPPSTFFIIKPTRCTNSTNLFLHETLHVSVRSFVHHQEFIHCTLSNGICHTGLKTAFEQEHMLLLESCLQTCMTYIIAECAVNKLLMMDKGTDRNM